MTDGPVGLVVGRRHPEPATTTTRSHASPAPSRVANVGKRCVDVVISFAALVCMAPLFLAIVIAIKLDSRGPAFFAHARVGRRGEPLRVLKFRTMVVDADETLRDLLARRPEQKRFWDTAFKLRDDPRITRVGRLLRRFSADELPQLVNVLRGEMSLVGPRPVVEEELERFGSSAAIILRAVPGITGLWAVSGRSDISYDERVELECRYVTDWSLRLDLSILVRTIPVVLRGRGSY
ncbi:MAG TPA: sugar transferase [Actinomycetota bacterium]|nr:sugar transferase [Actinomycetota bacterium]